MDLLLKLWLYTSDENEAVLEEKNLSFINPWSFVPIIWRHFLQVLFFKCHNAECLSLQSPRAASYSCCF